MYNLGDNMKKGILFAAALMAASLSSNVFADICDTYLTDIDAFVKEVNSTKGADATAKKSATVNYIQSKQEIKKMASSFSRTRKCTTGSTSLANSKLGWRSKYGKS